MSSFTADGFSRIWGASTASNLADGIRSAAFPLLAAVSRDAVAVAGVTVAQQLPWLTFGLLGGAIADRVDARQLTWGLNALRAVLLAWLTTALVMNATTLPWLLVIAFALGAIETLVDNAYPALVVAVVPDHRLDWANSRLVASSIAGNELLGPATGAWLFAIGVALPVAVDSGLLAAAALFLLSLPAAARPASWAPTRTDGLAQQIVAGLRLVRDNRRLRVVTLAGSVFSLVDTAWYAVLVLFVLEELALTEAAFGLLLAVAALGGLGASAIAEQLARRTSSTTRLMGSLVVAAISQTVVGLSSNVTAVAMMLAASSAAFALWNVTTRTLRQREAPIAMLGRVTAAYRSALIGAGAAGGLLGGLVASIGGLRAPMLLGGPVLMVTALLAWLELGDEG